MHSYTAVLCTATQLFYTQLHSCSKHSHTAVYTQLHSGSIHSHTAVLYTAMHMLYTQLRGIDALYTVTQQPCPAIIIATFSTAIGFAKQLFNNFFAIEKCIQKKRQRSSLLFGGTELLQFLAAIVILH